MASTAARDPAIAAILKRPFAQQVAFFRAKLGNLVPTVRWTDMLRGAHDRGFMVAGAQSADLLAGLGAAVDRAVSEGKSIDAFRRDFAQLVKDSGWDYRGEFGWRTRTIYRTNIATSYAAGREAQLREGGFAYQMYKHGGSAEPRPEHLAWDGLVLPADHPFWATHSPPNGFGCSCRKVGLRDAEDALRLGGDPDKPLPSGWDTIDPKTGAPVGIGKGWDYRPGDTVADTVQQMAAKTQQWDYTLAKAYMQGVPEGVRDAIARAYRDLPSVATDTQLYAQRILEGRAHLEIPPYRTLGLATRAQVATIAQLKGMDVGGFDFALDRSAVGHVQLKHGNPGTEAARGQFPVTATDYARLPQMLNTPDAIEDAGNSDVGAPVIRISKQIDGRVYVAVFELRARRRTLALQSFWIRRP